MSFKNVKRLTAVALDPEVLGPCHNQHEIDVCDKEVGLQNGSALKDGEMSLHIQQFLVIQRSVDPK